MPVSTRGTNVAIRYTQELVPSLIRNRLEDPLYLLAMIRANAVLSRSRDIRRLTIVQASREPDVVAALRWAREAKAAQIAARNQMQEAGTVSQRPELVRRMRAIARLIVRSIQLSTVSRRQLNRFYARVA